MITSLKPDTAKALAFGMAYALGLSLGRKSALAMDEPRWITVGAKEAEGQRKKTGGSHVLIESTNGKILGGLGGRFTGKTIKQVKASSKKAKAAAAAKAKETRKAKAEAAKAKTETTTQAKSANTGYSEKVYAKLDKRQIRQTLNNPFLGPGIEADLDNLKNFKGEAANQEAQKVLDKARKEAEERFKPVTQDAIAKMPVADFIDEYDQGKWRNYMNAFKFSNDIDPTLNLTSCTQHLAQYLGKNEKPRVVDSKKFDEIAKNSPFPVMYRTVNPSNNGLSGRDINDITRYGDKTYLGNGVSGDGIYFAKSKMISMGYGGLESNMMRAVIDPAKAKVISIRDLKYNTPESEEFLRKSHSSASDISMLALKMGYNVIEIPDSGYYNVLDRGCLIIDESDVDQSSY